VSGERGEVPTPAEVAADWPRELLGVGLLVLSETDSTQRFARAILDRFLAEHDEPPPCFVIAVDQSAGRGRRGRRWVSGAGKGLWASMLLRFAPQEMEALPLRVAVAVADGLSQFVPGIGLKWPNDVLVGGDKLVGMLIEVVRREAESAWAVIGVGVNVEHRDDERPTPRATSIRLAAPDREPPRLGLVAAAVGGSLWRELTGPSGDWLARYRSYSVHREGDPMACDLDGERVEGRFAGFDESGSVHLRLEAGERVVSSGDVHSW